MESGDQGLMADLFMSDKYEPSLGMRGGLIELIVVTPEEKAAERKRVASIKAERDAILARWAKEDAAKRA